MARKNGNLRCVICNCVSSSDIETEESETSYKAFHEVVYGKSGVPAFFCNDCSESIGEVRSDYNMDDNERGWDNHGDIFGGQK